MDIFFSVRTTKSDKLTAIDFLIRTQWKYTTWTMISFSFIAEDQSGIEANFFSIDTTALAGCSTSNIVNVILPFKVQGFAAVKTLTFLHGFEVTSVMNSGSNSPFEVQIINVSSNSAGISLVYAVVTAFLSK